MESSGKWWLIHCDLLEILAIFCALSANDFLRTSRMELWQRKVTAHTGSRVSGLLFLHPAQAPTSSARSCAGRTRHNLSLAMVYSVARWCQNMLGAAGFEQGPSSWRPA